jgi:hypothetical protein
MSTNRDCEATDDQGHQTGQKRENIQVPAEARLMMALVFGPRRPGPLDEGVETWRVCDANKGFCANIALPSQYI